MNPTPPDRCGTPGFPPAREALRRRGFFTEPVFQRSYWRPTPTACRAPPDAPIKHMHKQRMVHAHGTPCSPRRPSRAKTAPRMVHGAQKPCIHPAQRHFAGGGRAGSHLAKSICTHLPFPRFQHKQGADECPYSSMKCSRPISKCAGTTSRFTTQAAAGQFHGQQARGSRPDLPPGGHHLCGVRRRRRHRAADSV